MSQHPNRHPTQEDQLRPPSKRRVNRRHLHKPSHKDVPQWSDFEFVTKIGLEALGYTVIRDVQLAGSQVDLYAELPGELYVHRVVVECKDHAREIGIETVRQFHALIDSITSRAQPVTGLIVSRRGFTRTAKTFAESVNLMLFELDALLKLSFDPFTVITHISQTFDRDDLKSVYVELSCQVNEGIAGTIYKPVEQFLDTFLYTTKRSGVALLGNFGSGKTSLCKHYSYLMASRYNKTEQNCFLPIYINLRDVQNLYNLEQDILTILQTEYGAKVTPQGWNYWLLHRPTLLLLDGFDEMASRMDKIDINKNIAQLLSFSEKYCLKLILTCRTHFFKTEVEEQALGTMLRLYIRDWGTEELVDYVSKSLPSRTESSLETIRSTYNLEELSKTPIFLNMITATISEVKGVVSQSRLYQVYTDRWIQNQDYRSKLSPADKELFMEELAFEMFIIGQSRIHHVGLPGKIKELLRVQDYEALNALDRDIRTCSFLVRNSDGEYHFAHRSYMEFFVAFKLAKEMKANRLDNFSKRELSIEIAGFLANYFEDELEIIIRHLIGSEDSTIRANCSMILGCSGYSQEIFTALSLAIKTDKDQNVKYRAVDALSSFNEKESILELVSLTTEVGDFGGYCLRCLAPYLHDPDVLELSRRILLNPQDVLRTRIILENIERTKNRNLNKELLIFCHSKWWERDSEVTRTLISAIEVTEDLSLIMMLELIENSKTINHEIITFIKKIKHDLAVRYRSQIEKEAIGAKSEGLTRPRNEGRLRKKYGFLVDQERIGELMKGLYSVEIKGRQVGRSR